MTLEQAFSEIVNDNYLWSLTNESPSKRRYYKHALKVAKPIKRDLKEKILKLAGFRIVVTEDWSHPKAL